MYVCTAPHLCCAGGGESAGDWQSCGEAAGSAELPEGEVLRDGRPPQQAEGYDTAQQEPRMKYVSAILILGSGGSTEGIHPLPPSLHYSPYPPPLRKLRTSP